MARSYRVLITVDVHVEDANPDWTAIEAELEEPLNWDVYHDYRDSDLALDDVLIDSYVEEDE